MSFDISKYSSILEYLPKISNDYNIFDEILTSNICSFLTEYKIKKILISLSGGVDSMVLNEIIYHISKKYDIEFLCCHINYNNRDESVIEREFLVDYCNFKSINLKYIDLDFTRNESKRKTYEKETRDIRYDYYKKLCKEYNCDGVFLAHHNDDLSENIFNNIMRGGREITDLSVFKKQNNILNVNIFRPLLDFQKKYIYEFAHKFNIPYFLDTTPDWSCRGKMRRKIFPECEECYGNNVYNNLLKIGEESENINNILQKYTVEPLYNKISFVDKNFIIQKEDILKEKYILRLLLKKICYELNIQCIRQKNIELLIHHFNENRKITIMKNYVTNITDKEIKFIYM